jgi:hypothetical protein
MILYVVFNKFGHKTSIDYFLMRIFLKKLVNKEKNSFLFVNCVFFNL